MGDNGESVNPVVFFDIAIGGKSVILNLTIQGNRAMTSPSPAIVSSSHAISIMSFITHAAMTFSVYTAETYLVAYVGVSNDPIQQSFILCLSNHSNTARLQAYQMW